MRYDCHEGNELTIEVRSLSEGVSQDIRASMCFHASW